MTKSKKKHQTTLLSSFRFGNIFQNEKVNFIIGIILFGIAIFLFFSFISFISTGSEDQNLIENFGTKELLNQDKSFKNLFSSLGAYISNFFINEGLGLASFIIPFFIMTVSLKIMRVFEIKLPSTFFGLALVMIWLSVTFAKFLTPLFSGSFINPGGSHGMYVSTWIENIVGSFGLIIILLVIALSFLTVISTKTIFIIRRILNPHKIITDRVKFVISNKESDGAETPAPEPVVQDTPAEAEPADANEAPTIEFEDINRSDTATPLETPEEAAPEQEEAQPDDSGTVDLDITPTTDEVKAEGSVLAKPEEALKPYDPKLDLKNYRYPQLELLNKNDNDSRPYIDMAEQNANKDKIVNALRSFGVEISSIKATVGPTITLYEITPAQGVKISKIRNLEDDIALSIAAIGIRIIAPIAGKGTIGIEVPNAKPSTVSMESILNSKKYQETTMDLPCAVGKTITNEVFMFDLAKIPHLLVAGATGQGKSVGLNTMLTSLLYKKHPAELKIVLIDPKKVEFSLYTPIANHFLAKVPDDDFEPIITDVTKVVRTLNSLCKEMDTRYDLLKIAGTKNIKEYNQKFINRQLNPEKGHTFMPYIVVVIDEFGDLIMTAGKEIETPIARIAQLARAVGIHMIIATQRPTTNIITGNIKANFPGRIAFKVSQSIDSKTILDRPGANRLIGRGDMLFLNGAEPIRVQCAFVDTPEVERVNSFISKQQGYTSCFELPEPDYESDGIGAGSDIDFKHFDALFEDAARLIVLNQSGSTSMIQRKFSIGYNRAGRIMDQMEKAGIVGTSMGGKPREVLIQDEQSLQAIINSIK